MANELSLGVRRRRNAIHCGNRFIHDAADEFLTGREVFDNACARCGVEVKSLQMPEGKPHVIITTSSCQRSQIDRLCEEEGQELPGLRSGAIVLPFM